VKAITHRDQIHGDVRFDPLAVALLNTPALQRLGRIYQLGYAHLVYRGGTHTRLSHVMGASHVAGQIVEFLRQNYLEGDLPLGAVDIDEFLPKGRNSESRDDRWDVLRYLVRWAALLHDVGHVPLGHTLEDEFDGIYVKHDSFASPRIPYLWHETLPGQESGIRQVFRQEDLLPESFRALAIGGEQAWQTVMLLCLHKESITKEGSRTFKEVLDSEDDAKMPFLRILKAALVRTEARTFFPYMADIVGNTICADYLDYLRRDPINVGLDVLRDNRVASRFFVARDAKGSLRMALALEDRHGKPRLDTCTGVVELVRQRFRFAEIIYYHKTKVAASAMLAKAFGLVGKPDEVGPEPAAIDIDEIQNLTQRILSGKAGVADLRRESFPSNLLDPTIGDETLLLWLQGQAWEVLEHAVQSKDDSKVNRSLRGLSLLQALVRRKLYKICFTVDRNIYAELCPGSKESPEIERRIAETLDALRPNEIERAGLESTMASAAGWPDDALLLYVPPRKSQAKGIETRALDRGDVVTLGNHSAVKEEVLRLNDAYKALWRIILLVHPKYREDVVGLSKAVDALVAGLWPNVDKRLAIKGIRDAAWFQYIPEKQRPAAQDYSRLVRPEQPDWGCFEEAGFATTDGTVSTGEHAERAVLLSKVSARGGSAEVIRKQFGDPNSLSQHIRGLEPKLTVEGREGDSELRLAVIDKIARELVPVSLDDKSSKAVKRRKSGSGLLFQKGS
jgi:HD superfamily phosphohydrolase